MGLRYKEFDPVHFKVTPGLMDNLSFRGPNMEPVSGVNRVRNQPQLPHVSSGPKISMQRHL